MSSDLVMRVLGESSQLLAGSPALLDRLGRPQSPADLKRFESLSLQTCREGGASFLP